MKRKKGFLYIMGVGMAMSALLASCADDESFSTSRGDVLSFSVDTLKMDTTFSNVPTPTRSEFLACKLWLATCRCGWKTVTRRATG